jgi:hypothetical protein
VPKVAVLLIMQLIRKPIPAILTNDLKR